MNGRNAKVLALVQMLQAHRNYVINRGLLLGAETDWMKETKCEFLGISRSVLNELDLKQCDRNFLELVGFKVTDDMLNSTDAELDGMPGFDIFVKA